MTWRKSSHGADADCCVWVDVGPDSVRLRGDGDWDFTEAGWPVTILTHPEWDAFVAGVKGGEFDLNPITAEPRERQLEARISQLETWMRVLLAGQEGDTFDQARAVLNNGAVAHG